MMSSLKTGTGPLPALLKNALSACRTHFLYAAGFSAVINLLYLAPTLYMLQVYDRVVPTRGVVTLLFLTFLLLVSLGALAMLEVARSRLLVRASARLDRELSGHLLAANLDRRLGARAREGMRDFDTFRQAVTGGAILALFDAPWALIYIALCFVLHPVLGAMALLGSAALLGLSVATDRATRPRLEAATKAASWSYTSQAQTAGAGELIEALGMRPAVVRRHLDERSGVTVLQAEASFAAGGFVGATKFVRLALQSLGLGAGAWLALGQQISPGAIFAASLLMSRALSPLEMVLASWRPLNEARTAFLNLTGLLRATDGAVPRTRLPTPSGRLMVENLTVGGVPGERPILRDLSFEVQPGEVLGLVGPSGAGKSTLARAIVGALSPLEGQVRLDHASLTDWDVDRLGRHIGYLPQELGLLQGTIKQNICRFRDALGEDGIDEKAVAAAQVCGAHEMILRLPRGYDTQLGWSGAGLSLGQAQRVALARAFFDHPRLIVLDEPNAHLDGEGETRLLQAISHLKARGAALVLVAHRATVLPVIDSLLVLNEGRLAHHGPRDAVLSQLNNAQSRPPQLAPAAQAAA